MFLIRLVSLLLIGGAAPGLGSGVAPLNFLISSKSKDHSRSKSQGNVTDAQRSTLSIKDRSLISALDSLASELTPKSSKYGDLSTSLFFPSLSAENDLPPVIVPRSKIPKHDGKYGTTRHLKQIFIGRCYEYQYRKETSLAKEWDCLALWELFFNAFAFKGPCDVTSQDYTNFLDAIDEPVEKDKGLLWSGTREVAHKLSDFYYTKKYTTLEDTLAGYLLSGLTWCGHPNLGMNFKECPWSCSLQSPYWSLANARFAEKLRGVVHVILNGTRRHLNDGRTYPTYMKDRYYLGPNAVPALKSGNIEKMVIIVAHTLHLEPMEFCGEKSVKVLEDELRKKGIPVECLDDPKVSRYVFCASDPEAEECKSVETGVRSQTATSREVKAGGQKSTKRNDIGYLLPKLYSVNSQSPPARL